MGEGTRRTLLALVLGIVAAAMLSELAVRLLTLSLGRRPLLVRSEVTGWKLEPNLRGAKAFRSGGYAISTDSEGNRLTRPAGSPASPTPQIVLVGDSFVQGLGVRDEESLGWLLSRATSRDVVNLGVLGFGTDQELRALEHYLETHPSRRIGDVVVVVFENDFAEVQNSHAPYIERSKPTYRIVGDDLEAQPFSLGVSDVLMDGSQLFWLVRSKLSLLFPPSEPAPDAGMELVVRCLDRMAELVRERGSNFHLIAHRYPSAQRILDDAEWQAFVERAQVVDITPRLEDGGGSALIGFDGLHWNESGNRLVATIVEAMLE